MFYEINKFKFLNVYRIVLLTFVCQYNIISDIYCRGSLGCRRHFINKATLNIHISIHAEQQRCAGNNIKIIRYKIITY